PLGDESSGERITPGPGRVHAVLSVAGEAERPIEIETIVPEPGGDATMTIHILRAVGDAERRAREAQSRTRAILDTVLDCVITIDHRGRVLEFNPAAERTFGFRRVEIIGQELASFIIPEELRERHRVGLARYLASGTGPVIGRRVELPALHADGTRLEVELAITRIALPGPPVFTAYLRDISLRARQDRHRNLRLSATHVLAQSKSAAAAVSGVLRAVCTALDWEIGYFWSVDRARDRLICRDGWSLPGSSPPTFERETHALVLARNEGLPGRCWASGESAWLLDLAHAPNFPRAAAAAADGLRAGFACPVASDSIIGVMEFFSHRLREPEPDLLETMTTVAGQLGQFIERAQAEDALRASEARFRGLMEQAPFSVQIFAPDGRTLQVNRAWEQLFGVRFEQIADYNVLEDAQLVEKGIMPYVRRGFAGEATRIPAIEYDPNVTIPGVSGHEDPKRWLGAMIYPLRDEAGEVREIVLVHEDISERRRAETALEHASARLEAALEAGAIATWTWDVPTNRLYADESLARLFGLDADAADGGLLDRYLAAIHPEDRDRVVGALERSLASGADYAAEYRIAAPAHPERWVIARGRPEAGADGRALRMIGVLVDITERKHLEQELGRRIEQLAEAGRHKERLLASLGESEEKFRMLADTIPQLAWMAQPDGHIFWYNRRWHAYTGSTPEEMQGWGWTSVHDPVVLPDVIERWKRSIDTGAPFEMVFPLRGADGTFRPFLTRVEPLRDRRGRLIYWFGTNTDIGEIKRMEDALRDADRRKDEFLATLAHELRNPLAPIRNALEILRLSGDSPKSVQHVRELMERQVHHLVRLVDDLLDVSRVMRGKIELRRERIGLASVVERAVETARPLLDAQSHALEVALPPEPLELDADPIRLSQVFANLLSNAAKYTDREGHVSLTAVGEGADIVVRVRDDGIGIAPEMLPQLFDLLVQADHAAMRSQGGLGIGLTLVKNLVEMHGGEVSAHSAGLGRGAEFVVRLPLARTIADSAGANANDRGKRAASQPHRILVVDDNRDAAESLAELLRLQGSDVRVAHDGATAIDAAAEFAPDLVLLDLGMPGMDGYDVARTIRSDPRTAGAYIAALTGWGQPEDRRRTAEAGFDVHLVKPLEPESLDRVLAGVPRRAAT
ncbi:MAG TPA: PAS domain S-box protein, partial [Candidatus Saccharimonadia bacterium]|nr:PAS domain S-box protein [Candidatus Saccharimonadia bacterium]